MAAEVWDEASLCEGHGARRVAGPSGALGSSPAGLLFQLKSSWRRKVLVLEGPILGERAPREGLCRGAC